MAGVIHVTLMQRNEIHTCLYVRCLYVKHTTIDRMNGSCLAGNDARHGELVTVITHQPSLEQYA